MDSRESRPSLICYFTKYINLCSRYGYDNNIDIKKGYFSNAFINLRNSDVMTSADSRTYLI